MIRVRYLPGFFVVHVAQDNLFVGRITRSNRHYFTYLETRHYV